MHGPDAAAEAEATARNNLLIEFCIPNEGSEQELRELVLAAWLKGVHGFTRAGKAFQSDLHLSYDCPGGEIHLEVLDEDEEFRVMLRPNGHRISLAMTTERIDVGMPAETLLMIPKEGFWTSMVEVVNDRNSFEPFRDRVWRITRRYMTVMQRADSGADQNDLVVDLYRNLRKIFQDWAGMMGYSVRLLLVQSNCHKFPLYSLYDPGDEIFIDVVFHNLVEGSLRIKVETTVRGIVDGEYEEVGPKHFIITEEMVKTRKHDLVFACLTAAIAAVTSEFRTLHL